MANERPSIFPSYTKKWYTTPYPTIHPARPELSAKGKNIIITGGGTGIGRATAYAFAQASASSILLLGRRAEPLSMTARELNDQYPYTNTSYATGSTLSPSALSSAFSSFSSQVGPLDILVLNAGFLNKPTTIMDADAEDWWTTFEVNIRGTFYCVRAFLPLARPRGDMNGPVILNVSSSIAHLPARGMHHMSAYAASKVAGAKMMEFLAEEQRENGVRIFNVQPGVVMTEMSGKHGAAPGLDEPELPAHFLVWLCSPEAKFLNGKFVWSNWDVDELKARAVEIEKNAGELQLTLKGPVFV